MTTTRYRMVQVAIRIQGTDSNPLREAPIRTGGLNGWATMCSILECGDYDWPTYIVEKWHDGKIDRRYTVGTSAEREALLTSILARDDKEEERSMFRDGLPTGALIPEDYAYRFVERCKDEAPRTCAAVRDILVRQTHASQRPAGFWKERVAERQKWTWTIVLPKWPNQNLLGIRRNAPLDPWAAFHGLYFVGLQARDFRGPAAHELFPIADIPYVSITYDETIRGYGEEPYTAVVHDAQKFGEWLLAEEINRWRRREDEQFAARLAKIPTIDPSLQAA